jgi:hypothetical protein
MNHIFYEKKCSECGMEVKTYDSVCVSNGENSKLLCSRCYNKIVSKEIGLNFDHISFHPVVLKDIKGDDHTFHFQTFLFGDHVSIKALEIKDNESKGYEFSIHGEAEVDLFALFAKLVDRLRRELERVHIEPCDITRYSIAENVVRGQITWDEEINGEVPCLIIDGKEISWHKFGRMLMTFEGFHFKIDLFEGDEER